MKLEWAYHPDQCLNVFTAGYNLYTEQKGLQQKEMNAPTRLDQQPPLLKASWIDTELGGMIAIADDCALYLLQFLDCQALEPELEKLRMKTKATIIRGISDPIESIMIELKSYFAGKIQTFKTPIHLLGSPFQRLVWQELMQIPYGQTRSYREQARSIGNHKACRAVANANGANPLAIIFPCHRIIHSNGDLGGYAGGIWRKEWLIEHEKRHIPSPVI